MKYHFASQSLPGRSTTNWWSCKSRCNRAVLVGVRPHAGWIISACRLWDSTFGWQSWSCWWGRPGAQSRAWIPWQQWSSCRSCRSPLRAATRLAFESTSAAARTPWKASCSRALLPRCVQLSMASSWPVSLTHAHLRKGTDLHGSNLW